MSNTSDNYKINWGTVTRAVSLGMTPCTSADADKLEKVVYLSNKMVDKLLRFLLIFVEMEDGKREYSLIEKKDNVTTEVVHDADAELEKLCKQKGIPVKDIPKVKEAGLRLYQDFATKSSREFSNFLLREGKFKALPIGTQVKKMTAEKISKIVDLHLKAVLSSHLTVNRGKKEKAFRDENNPPMLHGKPIPLDQRILLKSDLQKNGNPVNRDYTILQKLGILPLCDLPMALAYSVCKQVQSTLKSHNEIKKNYMDKRKEWENKVASHPDRSILKRYQLFLQIAGGLQQEKGIGNIKKWNANHFKRFISSWLTTTSKDGKVEKGLRDFLLEKLAQDKHYKFNSADEHFGYQAVFLQEVFDNFRDMWEKKDIFGDMELVRLIAGGTPNFDDEGDGGGENRSDGGGLYHWLKDHINIPTTSAYDKKARLLLGSNLINFSIDFGNPSAAVGRNSDWILKMKNPLIDGDFISFRVFGGRYLNELTVEPSSKDYDHSKGQYRIEFVRTQGNKVRYGAKIAEPTVRWIGGTKYKLDIPTSELRIVSVGGKKVDYLASVSQRMAIRNYFMSSSKTNVKQNDQDKHIRGIPEGWNLVLGLDVGMNPSGKLTVGKWRKNNKSIEYEIIAEDQIIENDCNLVMSGKAEALRKKMSATKKLLDWTRKIMTGEETDIPELFGNRQINGAFYSPLDWQALLDK